MMNATTVTCPNCGRTNRLPAAASGRPRCSQCKSWLPWIVSAGDDDFVDIAEKASIPVVVDLWAQWCGPCRAVSPALEKVARDLAGQIKLVKVDVDAAPRLSQRYEVQSIPTLLVVENGQVVSRKIGALPAPALRSWVEQVISVKS
jgi:thioredoxin 2